MNRASASKAFGSGVGGGLGQSSESAQLSHRVTVNVSIDDLLGPLGPWSHVEVADKCLVVGVVNDPLLGLGGDERVDAVGLVGMAAAADVAVLEFVAEFEQVASA